MVTRGVRCPRTAKRTESRGTGEEDPRTARGDGRALDELRPVSFERDYTVMAPGSVLVSFGRTKVLCTASIEDRVPPWMRGSGKGWVTAEYSMLPGSTPERASREAAKGKQSGRTQEIQRLIARSLRAVCDLVVLGEAQITVDCDVLQADGGTRTASICGAYVALHDAFSRMQQAGTLRENPLTDSVAAISVGIIDGVPDARPSLRRGLPGRGGHERRHDRCRSLRRGAGDGRGHGLQPGRAGQPARDWPRRASRSCRPPQAAVLADAAAAAVSNAAPLRLVLASANPDKVAEIAAVLADALEVELVPRPDDVPDVVEDGETLLDNARLKARALVVATGLRGGGGRHRVGGRRARGRPGRVFGPLRRRGRDLRRQRGQAAG